MLSPLINLIEGYTSDSCRTSNECLVRKQLETWSLLCALPLVHCCFVRCFLSLQVLGGRDLIRAPGWSPGAQKIWLLQPSGLESIRHRVLLHWLGSSCLVWHTVACSHWRRADTYIHTPHSVVRAFFLSLIRLKIKLLKVALKSSLSIFRYGS